MDHVRQQARLDGVKATSSISQHENPNADIDAMRDLAHGNGHRIVAGIIFYKRTLLTGRYYLMC